MSLPPTCQIAADVAASEHVRPKIIVPFNGVRQWLHLIGCRGALPTKMHPLTVSCEVKDYLDRHSDVMIFAALWRR